MNAIIWLNGPDRATIFLAIKSEHFSFNFDFTVWCLAIGLVYMSESLYRIVSIGVLSSSHQPQTMAQMVYRRGVRRFDIQTMDIIIRCVEHPATDAKMSIAFC